MNRFSYFAFAFLLFVCIICETGLEWLPTRPTRGHECFFFHCLGLVRLWWGSPSAGKVEKLRRRVRGEGEKVRRLLLGDTALSF